MDLEMMLLCNSITRGIHLQNPSVLVFHPLICAFLFNFYYTYKSLYICPIPIHISASRCISFTFSLMMCIKLSSPSLLSVSTSTMSRSSLHEIQSLTVLDQEYQSHVTNYYETGSRKIHAVH